MDLWGTLMQWNFGLFESTEISYLPMNLTRLVLQSQLSIDQGLQPDDMLPHLREKQLTAFRRLAAGALMVLAPVWAKGHFTLLVLRRTTLEEASV